MNGLYGVAEQLTDALRAFDSSIERTRDAWFDDHRRAFDEEHTQPARQAVWRLLKSITEAAPAVDQAIGQL